MSEHEPDAGLPDAMSQRQRELDRYLFDPGAPPAAEVVALERALEPLRWQPRPLELRVPREMPRPRRHLGRWLAAAAAIALVTGAAAATWRWSWPEGRPWRVLAGPGPALAVGDPVRLAPSESLLVRVARIGWLRVEGGAEIELVATRSNRHRLSLREGTLRAGIWAPPGTLAIRTPAGEVVDLGCEFALTADATATRVDVISGWVLLENWAGESVVPAGAGSTMLAGRTPTVPVFRDADPRFAAGVAALERGEAGTLQVVLATARARDVVTLLVLASRQGIVREPLVERAAELAPPATPDLVERARAGGGRAIWLWIGELPLPPPKRWLPHWRDRLPPDAVASG